MKKEKLKENLAKLKINKRSIAYKLMLEVIQGNNLIRPCWLSGFGKNTKNENHTEDFLELCKLLKLDVQFGNDALRGGKPGNYVKILTKIKD